MPRNKKKKDLSFVKYGRPIVHIPYRYIRLIATITVIYHLCTLGFNLELLKIAHHIKGHIGDYLNIIVENGYLLVYVLYIASFLGIMLNIFIAVVAMKMFSSIGKVFYWLLFVSVVLTVVFMCIIIILIFYMFGYAFSLNPDGMDSFYTSMSNYSNDGLTKTRLDIMQIELQCCGARNYTDWYTVEWYDINFVKLNSMNIKLVGEVPFSCCNIRTVFPCIHHGVESGANDYKYEIKANFSLNTDGCWSVMESRKTKSALTVAGYLFCQFLLVAIGFIPLRFLQTASNERHGFSLENYIYTGWLWGFYVGDKKAKQMQNDKSHEEHH